LAARARKDVYCEKPLSLTIAESRAMVRAAREHDIVFQTGSQQRTEYEGKFRKAVEYVRSGRIGRVRTVARRRRCPPRPCDLAVERLPRRGLGDVERALAGTRLQSILCPVGIHHTSRRGGIIANNANGMLADMGVHHSTSLNGAEHGP